MNCETYKRFFGTLADPTKLTILQSLEREPLTVSEICVVLDMEQSRVSHNLRTLKDLGFVSCTVEGRSRRYTLDEKTIKPLLALIQGHVDTYYKHYCKCRGVAKQQRWD